LYKIILILEGEEMTRPHQFSKQSGCYSCGAKDGITKEHAPPDMLFRGQDCGRLTVPSCPEHNGEKGGRDFAVLSALIQSVEVVARSGHRKDVPDAVRKAIERISPSYHRAKKSVAMKKLLSDPTAEFDLAFPFVDGSVDILEWMGMLTAALVWTATGTHDSGCVWTKAKTRSPCFFYQNDIMKIDNFMERFDAALQDLVVFKNAGTWRQGWQPTPPYPRALYQFSVLVGNAGNPNAVLFKHSFFGNVDFFTGFETTRDTMDKIAGLLGPQVEEDSWIV
jgi:hypothetical protein